MSFRTANLACLLCCVGLIGCQSGQQADSDLLDIVPRKWSPLQGYVQTYTYKNVGWRELKLHVYEPREKSKGATDEARPVMLLVHGGGWVAGNPSTFKSYAEYFASRGAVAVTMDYRLCIEPGVTLADCVADTQDAIRWIRTNWRELRVDPNRIAVIGESAGGHLAACTALLRRPISLVDELKMSSRPNAVLLLNPVLDLTSNQLIKALPGVRGSELGIDDPKHPLHRLSPITYVRPGLPPMWIAHGTSDDIVPFEQAPRFTTMMEQSGNRCELVVMEGKGHSFGIPWMSSEQTVVQVMDAMDEFLVSIDYLDDKPSLAVID